MQLLELHKTPPRMILNIMPTRKQRIWNQPELFVNDGDQATLDRDIVQAKASDSIGGDIRPGVRDRQPEFYPTKGKYERCPGCGGKVILPCLYCRTAHVIVPAGALQRLIDDVPRLEALEAAKSHRQKSA